MNILATGANGFVGNYVAEYFKSREHRICKHHRGSNLKLMYDLSDPDVIIHCAAAAGPWHAIDDIIRDNILFTQELLQLAKEFPPKLFIFMSSVSVYGDVKNSHWIYEDHKSLSPSVYGLSKILGEKMLREAKFPSVSLRCPGIVGPKCTGRNWPVRLAKDILKKKEVSLFNADSKFNSVIHVEDICKTIEALLGFEVKEHRIYNLCAEYPIKIKDAALALAKGLDKKLKYKLVAGKNSSNLFDSSISDLGVNLMSVEETMFRFGQEFANESA